MPRKLTKTRKRYTPAEKAKILASAKKLGLTGPQAAKKFGISKLTFYRRRGPIRGKKARTREKVAQLTIDPGQVRKAVREQVRKILPEIIREEIEAALR